AVNNGGWQWASSTGADAPPYFRIFNPVLQGQRFDPDGLFIRHWVPELKDLPNRFLYAPWTAPLEIQNASQCVIGEDYPAPIVPHDFATARAKALFASSLGARQAPAQH
ncbi:MAG: FAD-binding domain-containing protein, partial [Tepidiformaceae bacterium]